MRNSKSYATKKQLKRLQEKPTSNVVVYTRVSTKEQFETNESLETQKRVCLAFAKRAGFTVVKTFGETYESAKSDKGRKHFQEMLAYVKKHKKSICAIVVYDYSRFSRTEESIALVYQLKKLGINVLAASQPTDNETPEGKLLSGLQMLLANFDNSLKSQRTKQGITDKLKKGIWSTMPPRGYCKNKETGKIEINETGKLIGEAFYLVAAGYSVKAVQAKMNQRGLRLDYKRWGDVLSNAFYAGLIVHKLLDYIPVQGVHPAIVPLEIFDKVKEIRSQKELTHSYHDTDLSFPLKGFVICTCDRSFTTYQAKKKAKPDKQFFYYKCNNPTCYTNISVKKVEGEFKNFLSNVKLNHSLEKLFKRQLKAVFKENNRESIAMKRKLEHQMQQLEETERKLVEKWINDKLDEQTYHEFKARLDKDKKSILQEFKLLETELSNPSEFIGFSTYIAFNLDSLWEKSGYEAKKRLQDLVFPQGVYLNKQNMTYRTPEVNLIFKLTDSKLDTLGHKKSEITDHKGDYSASVPWAGVEPARV